MGLGVVKSNSGTRNGYRKLIFHVAAPGGQILVPAGSFITWMVLSDDSAVDNIVTIGTVLHGNSFFDDTVQPNIPYEVAKGWEVNVSTILYVDCSENLTVKLFKL